MSVQLTGFCTILPAVSRRVHPRPLSLDCVLQDLIPDGVDEYESEGDTLKEAGQDGGTHGDILKDVGPWMKRVLKKKMKDVGERG